MNIAEYNLYVAKQDLGRNPLSNHSYGFTPQFFAQPQHTPNTNKKDSDFDKILDDLFRTEVENMKRMGHDIVSDSIWEHDDDSKEDQEEDEPIHTTPPNDDYVAPATKLILDELLEEFGDKNLNVATIDKEADFNPTKDLEELERLLAVKPQSNFIKIQGCNSEETKFEPYRLCTCGSAWILNKLRGSIANRTSWMLYRWLVKFPVMLDIGQGSRLGAWFRACWTLYKSSEGGSRINT
ncbi:hypothetical protein Tco_1301071 [Tanacetum coccineum]